jgi:hypothetical protein
MSADDLAAALGRSAANELSSALARIKHCSNQLTDDQVWWRPHPSMNSIANLALHLCGNVRQWIVAGLSNADDARDRPGEFSERGPIPKSELLRRLEAVLGEARDVLERQTARELLSVRRIQGGELTGLAAIFDSVPHFRGHTQDIVHITRLLLGEKYRFAWKALTPEEGAPAAQTG